MEVLTIILVLSAARYMQLLTTNNLVCGMLASATICCRQLNVSSVEALKPLGVKGEYSRNVLSPVHICEIMIIVDPDTDVN